MIQDTPYGTKFFENTEEGSLKSARVIVPLVVKIVNPASVIDFGCGRGAWLSVFLENGVETVRGVDGVYVDKEKLLIPRAMFAMGNLEVAVSGFGQFDLAVCLEVVEHLSCQAALNLVCTLTESAPVVLFSGAIPGQGGTNHINEQWPQYWDRAFLGKQFHRIDAIRLEILSNSNVEWWYRQNIVLYASDSAIAGNEELRSRYEASRNCEFEIVHNSVLQKFKYTRGLFAQLTRTLRRAFTRRISR